jgi:hypothetical protein
VNWVPIAETNDPIQKIRKSRWRNSARVLISPG